MSVVHQQSSFKLQSDPLRQGLHLSFPDGSVGKESTCNAGDIENAGWIPGSGRSSGGGNVFLPKNPHGQRSLVGYSPQGCKELDMTEHTFLIPYSLYKFRYFD